MSSAERLIFIDACLSSLPFHTMEMFDTHAGFDKHKNIIFWEGQGNKKKYHLVERQDICKPKEQGGLEMINTKKMNIAWI
jgi:hypothetical protein